MRLLRALHPLGGERVRQLHSTMALIVTFPVTNEGGPAVDDRRAFITVQTAGEIGVAVGSLLPATTGSGPTPLPCHKDRSHQPGDRCRAAQRLAHAIAGTERAAILDIEDDGLPIVLACAAAGVIASTLWPVRPIQNPPDVPHSEGPSQSPVIASSKEQPPRTA